MSRTDPGIRVRIPVDLKNWLEDEAAHNLRTVSAEVIISVRERRDRLEREKRSAKITPDSVPAPSGV